jgi:hypothetical protein
MIEVYKVFDCLHRQMDNADETQCYFVLALNKRVK